MDVVTGLVSSRSVYIGSKDKTFSELESLDHGGGVGCAGDSWE